MNEYEYFCTKEGCKELIPTGLKPFPNEFSCRINDPDKYTRFRRENEAGKYKEKRLDFIWGIKSNGDVEIQAIRMPKDEWSESEAKSYCNSKEHISFE